MMNGSTSRKWLARGAMAAALALQPAVPGASAQRPMGIVDLIDVPSVGDVRLSPRGDFAAYVRTTPDWDRNRTVSHIWRARGDGSERVQLTNGEDGERSPRWSPDGSRLAFLARRAGDEATQVYLIRNDGGEAIRLTEHPTGAADIAWSPDGSWLYFIAAEEKTPEEKAREAVNDDVFAYGDTWKHRHLWRVPAAGGGPERVTGGDFTVRDYRLSRDGSLIVHRRVPTPLLDDGPLGELWLMDSAGGGERRLTDNRVSESDAELSPDNSRVLFVANANEDLDFYYNDKLFTVSASGGEPAVLLPDMPHEVLSARWSADGRSIFFLANTGVRQELFRVELRSGRSTQLTRGDHVVSAWDYVPALSRHAFTVSSPMAPADVWTMNDRGQMRRITNEFERFAADFRLPRTEVIEWSGADGAAVEGLLYYPLDHEPGRRFPLVVQTHGGPAASDKLGWHSSSSYVPVLAAMGYFVLKPNYRGSTGYGDDFLRDMVGHYFNQAHLDVMAGVDHLIARGLVDGERMAKMGWSAGGHMTNKIITHTDRFKAASSGAGAVNWMSMYAQSDTRVYRTPWFGGTPWEAEAPIERYLADSPIVDIHRVTTPTLVLVGQNDERVPMAQSVELYRALRANGVPTRLYVAPRQGHGWRELQQRLFKANVELDWFERYVTGREYRWERSPVHPAAAAVEETPESGSE
jgi:dipeptidyl aminopeptidase/acylaminoacyl peptidase